MAVLFEDKKTPSRVLFDTRSNPITRGGARTLRGMGLGAIDILAEQFPETTASAFGTTPKKLTEAIESSTRQLRQERKNVSDADTVESYLESLGQFGADPLLAVPALKYTGAITGGASMGLEPTLEGENRMANVVTGAALGNIMQRGLERVPQVKKLAQKKAAEIMGISPEKVATLEAAGVPLNMPAVSDSASVKTVGTASAGIPGGKPLRESFEKAFKQTDNELRKLGFTGDIAATPTKAGKIVQEGFERWQSTNLARFNKIDDKLAQVVPDTINVKNPEILSAKLEKIVNSPGITSEQIQDNLAHPAVKKFAQLLPAAERGEITMAALKKARTEVGMLMSDATSRNVKDAMNDRVYAALSESMEDLAGDVAGDYGKKLFTKRNKIYSNYIQEYNNFVGKTLKKLDETPEAVYTMLTSGDKQGASKATRILNKLNNAERDSIRDIVIRQKGGGDNFSVTKWATEYKKMSPEAKNVFFKGKQGLKEQHERLINAIDVYKDVGKFANTSRTAITDKILGWATLSATPFVGVIPAVQGAFLGTSANHLLSRGLSSPKFTKILAEAITSDLPKQLKLAPEFAKVMVNMGITKDSANAITNVLFAPDNNNGNSVPSTDTGGRVLFNVQDNNVPDGQTPTQKRSTLPRDIIIDEGLRGTSYLDTLGNRTVGIGFNMDDSAARKTWKRSGISADFDEVYAGNQGLTPQQSMQLANISYNIAVKDARSLIRNFDQLAPARQKALVNMSYQMGKNKLSGFEKMIKNIERRQWIKAANEVFNSRYAEQTPERARRIAMQILSGRS